MFSRQNRTAIFRVHEAKLFNKRALSITQTQQNGTCMNNKKVRKKTYMYILLHKRHYNIGL